VQQSRGDAYLLADLLRTDGHRFRPLTPPSDAIRALRALVRGRDDLVATRLQLANQLRALLESFWPGAAAIFADIDSPIALAFLERYPTPDSAARLGVKRLASFLAQHRYSGRHSPDELLARLRAAPQGLAGPVEAEAKGEMVRALVAVLGPLVTRILDLTARIRHDTAASEDGQIIMSFPRAGQLCAGQILAELGEDRARYLTPDQLAAGSLSDGPATDACAPRSPASRTTPATPALGPRASTPARAAEDVGIPTQSASSAAPGCACSGAPGRTKSHTIRSCTALPKP
jgi:transposase